MKIVAFRNINDMLDRFVQGISRGAIKKESNKAGYSRYVKIPPILEVSRVHPLAWAGLKSTIGGARRNGELRSIYYAQVKFG